MPAHAGVVFRDPLALTQEEVRRASVSVAYAQPFRALALPRCGALLLQWQPADGDLDGRTDSCTPRQRTLVTWDGRIDNRTSLMTKLGRPDATAASDGELAAAVYERWGIDGFRFIIGDWSLAVFDTSREEVVLASDYMGNRDLFYCCAEDYTAWSTHLDWLVRFCKQESELDPTFIAGYLAQASPAESTPYKTLRAVPAGTALTRTRSGTLSRTQFWTMPEHRLVYHCQEDYEAHFRDLFRDAVATRLSAQGTTWSDLSGGLDSSAIVCMANLLITNRLVPAERLRTYSDIASDSPETDERRFIDVVLEHCHLDTPVFGEIAEDGTLVGDDWVAPRNRLHARKSLAAEPAAFGCTWLSGRMGDLVTRNLFDDSASLVDSYQLGGAMLALRHAREWALSSRRPLIDILRQAVLPYLSSESQTRIRAAVERLPGAPADAVTALSLGPVSVAAYRPIDTPHLDIARVFPWAGKRTFVGGLLGYGMRRSLSAYPFGPNVQVTYPFSHRPLVEFMVAIPAHVGARPGEPRSLMKRALRNLLPPTIRGRFSKGYVQPALARSLRPVVEVLLRDIGSLRSVKAGYVDAASLRGRLVDICRGTSTRLGNIRQILALERWLRARELRSVRAA